MQRSVQSFLTSHGLYFGLENGSGTRVLNLDDDDDDDDSSGIEGKYLRDYLIVFIFFN